MNNPIDLDALASLNASASAPARTPGTIPANVVRIEGATPGCYALYISDDDYHGVYPGASSTALKKMLQSPAHYRAYMEGTADDDTDSRRFGRAVHALLLEPHAFGDKFAVWRDGRRAGKKFDEFEQQHAGKTILNESQHARAMEAALAMRQCQDIPILGDWLDTATPNFSAGALPAARTEFSIFWEETVGEGDQATVVLNKARVDLHGTAVRLALDVKTTDDARARPFYKQVVRLDYDLQAAHYSAGLQAFYGVPYKFGFAVVESCEPYGTHVFDIGEALFANGVAKRKYALSRLAECQRTNVWPGYEAGVQTLELSHWDEFCREA